MKIGLQFPASTVGGDPIAMRDFAQAAEGLGYTHLTFFEHILGTEPGSAEREHRAQYHELMVMLGYIAGVTRTIGLLTAVLVLPQRQAAVVAKQAAEVDIVSGGRLRLGVGVGSNAVEYQATGADFHTRGRRIEEQVALMRALWTNEWVTFNGRWHEIDHMGLTVPPVQRPIPVWMGGRSERTIERMGRMADGWLATSTNGVEGRIEAIHNAARAAGRDPSDIGIEGRMEIGGRTPREWMEDVRVWERLGATHLTVRGAGGPTQEIADARTFMEHLQQRTPE
jgi:probable F420-dependent oxidoreductase